LPIGVSLFRWTNPHPDRAIYRIEFSTDHAYASPALLGVTLLDP
jgi:hypothetical protein